MAVKEEEVESTDILDRPEPKKGKNKKGKDAQEQATPPRKRPDVSVAAIVGGMSAQKQRRIIDRGVDVLVATPGRLWDIMQEVRLVNLHEMTICCDMDTYDCLRMSE